MTTRSLTSASLALLVLGACGEPPAPVPHPEDEPHAPEAHEDHLDVPLAVQKNLGIRFVAVEPRSVAQTLRIPGAFELRPLARHEYRMALPGRVELRVDQYESVEAGQVLYRFQSPEWPQLLHEVILGEQAIETATAEIEVERAKLAEAETRLELSRRRLESLGRAEFKDANLEFEAAQLEASLPRIRAELNLAESRLANARRTREHALHRASTAAGITEEDLERTDGETDGALPTYLTLDWIEVRAADSGIVEELNVTDGAFVQSTDAVLSTVDPWNVRFRALALQTDLQRIQGATSARIVPPRSPGVRLEEGVEAHVSIGLEAHPEERTITLLAEPAAPAAWMRPGVSAFLEVVLAAEEGPSLAVPRSSVVQDGLEHVVFRRAADDPDEIERVEVLLGVDDGRWVAVEAGLALGDAVVHEGAYELQLALQQSRGGAMSGHVHADGSVDEH